MLLGKLKLLYEWIDKLNTNVKTIIIVSLAFVLLQIHVSNHTKAILEDYTKVEAYDKAAAEEYTKMITPIINDYVYAILKGDKDASNVLLLNYHNTLNSTHGLSYRYLTALTERRRGYDTKARIKLWTDLEYMNYGEEIELINDNQFLRMDSIQSYFRTFPNLCTLLEECDAKSAALYPLMGLKDPKGMIVILYKNKKQYHLGYYNSVIAPYAQRISILLDYNSVKEKFKEYYGSGQKEWSGVLQQLNPHLLE